MSGERSAVALGPGEGEKLPNMVSDEVTFLVRGEQTGGALIALISLVPPGAGPPLHVHTRDEETIYMLDDGVRWKLGEVVKSTPAGSFVFVPRGLAHCFQNIGDRHARILLTFAPAGMEGFFDRLSEFTEFDPDAFRRAAAEHGMEVVGPPLAESDPV